MWCDSSSLRTPLCELRYIIDRWYFYCQITSDIWSDIWYFALHQPYDRYITTSTIYIITTTIISILSNKNGITQAGRCSRCSSTSHWASAPMICPLHQYLRSHRALSMTTRRRTIGTGSSVILWAMLLYPPRCFKYLGSSPTSTNCGLNHTWMKKETPSTN